VTGDPITLYNGWEKLWKGECCSNIRTAIFVVALGLVGDLLCLLTPVTGKRGKGFGQKDAAPLAISAGLPGELEQLVRGSHSL
jgi:hypothetical protein